MYRHGQWPIEDSALVKALLCKMEFTVRALYGEGAEDENEKKTKTKKMQKKICQSKARDATFLLCCAATAEKDVLMEERGEAHPYTRTIHTPVHRVRGNGSATFAAHVRGKGNQRMWRMHKCRPKKKKKRK